MPKKANKDATATMEVPKSISVCVKDGLIKSADGRGSLQQLLFKHMQSSMNDKNSMQALIGLAGAHGVKVEEAK